MIIYICYVFCRYNNHDCVSQTVRINHGDECVLPPTTRMPTIFDNLFLFVRAYRTIVVASYNHIAQINEI
jgi:hypothetical protein